MKRLICLIAVSASTIARAEPAPEPTRYLELDGSLGRLEPAGVGWNAGVALGLQRSEHGWLRIAISAGPFQRYIDQGPGGPLVQVRAGYEARGCADSALLCGYAGLDLAAFFARNTNADISQTSSFAGVLAVPRAGLDIGGRALRLRFGVEAGLGAAATLEGPSRGNPAFEFALTAGVAYRW